MSLPTGELARKTVPVGDATVEIRSLSRKESLELAKFQDDAEAGEVYIIARATDSPEDEVRRFRETVNAFEIDNLLDAILTLSGLDQLQKKMAAKAGENNSPNA